MQWILESVHLISCAQRIDAWFRHLLNEAMLYESLVQRYAGPIQRRIKINESLKQSLMNHRTLESEALDEASSRSFQEPMSPCVRCNVVMSQWANGPQTLHQRIKQAMYHGHINSINQKRWLVASRSHGDKWPTVCSWVTAKWLVRLGDLNQNQQSSASINPWTSQT